MTEPTHLLVVDGLRERIVIDDLEGLLQRLADAEHPGAVITLLLITDAYGNEVWVNVGRIAAIVPYRAKGRAPHVEVAVAEKGAP